MPDPTDPSDSAPGRFQLAETLAGHPSAPAGDAATADAPRGAVPFVDVTPHARGGLGEVFRATDPDLHRTVAVKRLREELADRLESRRRFLVEAELTARLEHPGVVPVHSLFHDKQGRPGYAMRFVEGQTLAEAVDAYHAGPPAALAFRRLLQSFLQVCQTVAYAHSRGVIHRDLKPANVMLGKFGETLVVDWGLAKVVGRPEDAGAEPGAEGTLVFGSGSGGETAMGSAVGTPAYMSPEQAAGRWNVIDHRADVYGLGAVLYAILAGRPPLGKGDWPEMQQRIQRGDFPRPRDVKPGAPRPLEAVCLKAMAPWPEDRYPSAQAVAADVERWLADEPVGAYREPLSARARRWVRRHRTAAGAAAALLVAALAVAGVGLVVLGQKNREIAAERNAARDAAGESQAVNAFLTEDLLGQADPDANSRDKKVTVDELLSRAAKKIDGNAKFADNPQAEATLRLTIGKTYFNLGNLPEAEKHLRRAVGLGRESLPADAPSTLAAQEALADFLNRAIQRPAESEPLAKQTWESRSRVFGPEHRDTLDSLDTYAVAVGLAGRKEEAISLHRRCLEARMRTLGPEDGQTLTSMNNLAVQLNSMGRFEEAASLSRAVVAVHRKNPSSPSELVTSVYNLANTLYRAGELKEADGLVAEFADWADRTLGPDSPPADHMSGIAVAIGVDVGRLDEAITRGQDLLARRRKNYRAGPYLIGTLLSELGRARSLQGKFGEAERDLDEACTILRNAPGQHAHAAHWAQCWRGACLTGLKRYAEAEPLLVEAEEGLRTAPGVPARHYRQAVEQLVKLYDAWGKPREAAKWRDPPPAGTGRGP